VLGQPVGERRAHRRQAAGRGHRQVPSRRHPGQSIGERERAALAWAESLTHIADTHAPDAVYDEARRHFSEKELADLSIAIAMINAWNRLTIGARVMHPADLAKAA
jgi:alkylhydroperoxidase family enzyme